MRLMRVSANLIFALPKCCPSGCEFVCFLCNLGDAPPLLMPSLASASENRGTLARKTAEKSCETVVGTHRRETGQRVGN